MLWSNSHFQLDFKKLALTSLTSGGCSVVLVYQSNIAEEVEVPLALLPDIRSLLWAFGTRCSCISISSFSKTLLPPTRLNVISQHRSKQNGFRLPLISSLISLHSGSVEYSLCSLLISSNCQKSF
jgi:hypothetical protein